MEGRERLVLVMWLCSVAGVAGALLTPIPAFLVIGWSAEWRRVDLAAHLSLFFWLMLLPQAAEWGQRRRGRLALALVALGCGLEALQAMTGYRTVDGVDAAANLAGVALGVWTGRRWAVRVRSRKLGLFDLYCYQNVRE